MNLPFSIDLAINTLLVVTLLSLMLATWSAFIARRHWSRARIATLQRDEAWRTQEAAARQCARRISEALDRADAFDAELLKVRRQFISVKGQLTKARKTIEELEASGAGTDAKMGGRR